MQYTTHGLMTPADFRPGALALRVYAGSRQAGRPDGSEMRQLRPGDPLGCRVSAAPPHPDRKRLLRRFIHEGEPKAMTYTTHGLMTPADVADHQALTDTGPHPDCPGHEDAYGPYRHSAADHCPGDDGEVQAYDLQVPAPGGAPQPMSTADRLAVYARTNRSLTLTPRQRRRAVKRAGRDPEVTVTRDDGMGFQPSMQGYREILGDVRPVSGGSV